MSNNSKNQPNTGTNLKQAAQKLAEGRDTKRRALLKVLAIVTAILFLLLIIATIFVNLKKRRGEEETLSVPTRTISPPARAKPTHPVYGEDPIILEIEEKVRAMDQELIIADLEEAKLAPPILDLNINFER